MALAHISAGKIAIASIAANLVNATVITTFGAWTWPAISEQSLVTIGTAALVVWGNWQARKTKKVVTQIHTLSNSAMEAQLKINVEFATRFALQAHRLAAVTKQEGDIAAAEAADLVVVQQTSIYMKHQLQQAKIDTENE